MKTKHTPGPWTYEPGEGCLAPPEGSPRNQVGRFHCGRNDDGNDGRPTKADAALISAAPDLLAACENAVRDIVALTDAAPEFDPRYLREAIAKARGGR